MLLMELECLVDLGGNWTHSPSQNYYFRRENKSASDADLSVSSQKIYDVRDSGQLSALTGRPNFFLFEPFS